MTDPYAAWPEPPARSRAPLLLVLASLFGAGFVAVAALLWLRAPDGAPEPRGRPPGYVELREEWSYLTGEQAADYLGIREVPGFRSATLRAYGRRDGEPLRAVAFLDLAADDPTAARDAVVAAAVLRGAHTFDTPAGMIGYLDVQDSKGRFRQRVLSVEGGLLRVVTVFTPHRDADTAEIVRLASS
ncbi:MAG TPA: hypothetical protein VF519_17195 [Mycobacteriales bacterium]|jgi:hypothetical protein